MSVVDPLPGPHFFSRHFKEYGGKIPFIVTDCVKRLRELKAEEAVGTFRLSGQKSKVEEICYLFDVGRIKDWSNYLKDDVANAVKRYFRELSHLDPILDKTVLSRLGDLCERVAKETEIPKDNNTEKQEFVTLKLDNDKIQDFKAIFNEYDPTKVRTLAYFINYLFDLYRNIGTSSMDPYALSVCTAPNMVPYTNNGVPTESEKNVIKVLIFFCNDIFPSNEELEQFIMNDDDIDSMAEPRVDIKDVYNETLRRSLRKESIITYDRNELLNALHLKRPEREPDE